MGTGAPAGMERLGLQQCPGCAQRPAQLAVAAAADARLPRVGLVQAEDEPHRGRLARPVGAEKAGHDPRAQVEAERLDRERGAVAFGQIADFDHVISRVTGTPTTAGSWARPVLISSGRSRYEA